ncbi:hypothetical protein POM88_038117 [Heracleum sosnowskyi]|uniref:Uncharacterized protein n=1 Tax=Heracleum sosnowskyi TaxID=360622 RepID=A0AAD8HTY3_9APIA|nr:hypothetical protein POM88_038117 [Heracleum sosnowskyi]
MGWPNLKFSGLMTIGMAYYSSTPENFKTLSNCKIEVCKAIRMALDQCQLSTGMSGDSEQAGASVIESAYRVPFPDKDENLGRDLRVVEYGKPTTSGTLPNHRDLNEIPRIPLISNFSSGPEEEELNGLNIEGRKRIRTGHETQTTMDTEGDRYVRSTTQIQSADVETQEEEAQVSKNEVLAGVAMQLRLSL